MRTTALISALASLAAAHAAIFSLSTEGGVELSPGYDSWSDKPVPNLLSGTLFFVRKGSKEARCHTRGGPIRVSLDYHVTFGYNAKDDTLTMDHCGCDGAEGGKGVVVCEYEDGGGRLDCVGKNTHDPSC